MKKALALIMTLAMAVSLAACGGGSSSDSGSKETAAPAGSEEAAAPSDYLGVMLSTNVVSLSRLSQTVSTV